MLHILLTCADAQLAPVEHAMQTQLLHNAVLDPRNKGNIQYSVRRYFGIQNIEKTEICTWTGVKCTNGRVTRFIMMCRPGYGRDIDMNWLPNSVKVIHFLNLYLLDGYPSTSLPRDLEYLYLMDCASVGLLKPVTPIDLRQLPVSLEELHLINSTWASPPSPLYLTALPTKLRILQIRSWRIGPSYIDWALLPRALEYIGLSCRGKKKPKVVNIGHASESPHLEIDHGLALFTSSSHFFYECADVVNEIDRRHC